MTLNIVILAQGIIYNKTSKYESTRKYYVAVRILAALEFLRLKKPPYG